MRLPGGMRAVWMLLFAVAIADGLQVITGVGGDAVDDLFQEWLHTALILAAAALCLARATGRARDWAAWAAFGAALACWGVGEVLWTVLYRNDQSFPAFSVADVFWLAWYPLAIAGVALLVRDTVPGFELHRWIDGLAIVLIVATAGVGLVLDPVAEESAGSGLAKTLQFVYPLGDIALVGAVIGVFPLLAWRPLRVWLILGLGLAIITISDAVYSVQALEESYEPGAIDSLWPLGALLVAYAALQPVLPRLEALELRGWAAVALPLAVQFLAIAINVYGYFHHLPESERILTVAVLVIAMIQIVVSRPRAKPARSARA